MAGVEESHPKPLNGAQFSQGTLFNMKPEPQHRWPRGYTPERQAEVSHYFPTWNTQADFGYAAPESPYLGDAGLLGDDIPERRRKQGEQATRMLTDIVARSTVPTEALENLPTIKIKSGSSMPNAAGMYQQPGTRGMYEKPLSGDRGSISLSASTTVKNRADYEKTALHEIGHHADFNRDRQDYYNRSYFTMAAGPIGHAAPGLEGYAEGFAQGHWRGRRGQEGPSYVSYSAFHRTGNFMQPFQEASGGRSVASFGGRAMEQPGSVNPVQFDQPHLFERNVESSVTQAPGYKDWGQHELEMDWQREPWKPGEPYLPTPKLETQRIGRGSAVHFEEE